jgi:hypothetical protein
MNYDVTLIRKMAAKLYSRAVWTVCFWTFSGMLVGAYAGLGWQRMVEGTLFYGEPMLASLGGCAMALGLIGYAIGRSQDLDMQFRAQIALCVAEIERNTTRA